MARGKRWFLCLLGLGILALLAPAVTSQEKAAVTVTVAVRVFDGARFVDGLTREDFEIEVRRPPEDRGALQGRQERGHPAGRGGGRGLPDTCQTLLPALPDVRIQSQGLRRPPLFLQQRPPSRRYSGDPDADEELLAHARGLRQEAEGRPGQGDGRHRPKGHQPGELRL